MGVKVLTMKEIAKKFKWKAVWYVIETLRANGIDVFHAGSKKLVSKESEVEDFIKYRFMTGRYFKPTKWRASVKKG